MAKFNIPGNYDMVSTAFISDVSARFSNPINIFFIPFLPIIKHKQQTGIYPCLLL